MATEILATDDTADTSTEIPVGDGESVTVGIKDAEFGASLVIEIEYGASPSEWDAIGYLVSNVGERVRVIAGPGNYRVRRAAGVLAGAYLA